MENGVKKMMASDLIIDELREWNLEECIRATKQIIRAHNKLVYHQFATPHDLVRVKPEESKLNDREICDLVALVALWGWYCRCVAPTKVQKGPIYLCSDCNKPVILEDE